MRIDKLQVDLPKNTEPDPAAAAIVQELMGGRFGEMSTLNNYMYQSFNMRGRNDIVPFYDLVASITAEEFGHVELVAAAINLLQNGGEPDDATPKDSPLTTLNGGNGIRHQFVNNGNSALAANSLGAPWQGDYVFNSGNLVLDMLHNFFLESGARMGKLRVYESSTNPVVKRLTGYLLVRGGVHQLAYAVALSKLTGVEVPKMLPIPDIRTDKIPECQEFIAKNLHNTLYRFSPDDYTHIGDVFNGNHPEDGSPLRVSDGHPDGHPLADLPPAPASGIPSFDMGEMKEIAARLMRGM
ncbi:MAG: manganese catalase family protein [Janthinobacterium lividum]